MLSIEHISAGYNGRVVLHDVSLCAQAGEIIGLVGPNGAGKSSLLRVISGILPPLTGTVRLTGQDLTRLSATARAREIAVVPQNSHLPEAFTVGEVVLMGWTPHLSLFGGERPRDYEIAQDAMARADVVQFGERLVGELSGGEQQRVLIARALAQVTDAASAKREPRALLPDEARAHLDLKHQTALWGLVRQLARAGLVVIAALHDLNLAAQFADRLALLSEGKLLVCDEPSRVLTSEWLRRAYEVGAVISSHPVYHTPLVALVEDEV
jgi:iron complex transport system ATP-binding protein